MAQSETPDSGEIHAIAVEGFRNTLAHVFRHHPDGDMAIHELLYLSPTPERIDELFEQADHWTYTFLMGGD